MHIEYIMILPSQLLLKNTPTASLQGGKTPSPMSVLDMTENNLMVRFQKCWRLENAGYLFIAIAPSFLWPGVVASDKALSMGQLELNCELILNRNV